MRSETGVFLLKLNRFLKGGKPERSDDHWHRSNLKWPDCRFHKLL